MTRGQKGCDVYFVDAETRRYFEQRIGKSEPTIVPYENSLPLLSLRAAADASYARLDGYLPESDDVTWVQVFGGPFAKDRFLVRAEGDSVEPMIQDGQLCIFRRDSGGSRNGKIVLCAVRGFAGDSSMAVIKRYRSARTATADSIGEATAIVLSSINERHEDIVVTNGENLSILGIFERSVNE